MKVPPSDSRDDLSLFTEEGLLDLYNRLRRYAYKHYWWIPECKLEELIQDTMLDTLTHKRKWQEGTEPTKFLINVFRSKAYHWWQKKSVEEPQKESLDEGQEAGKPRRISRQQYIDDMDDPVLEKFGLFYTEDTQQKMEDEQKDEQFFKEVRELLGDNQILIGICELFIKYPGIKPKEVAERLGISIERMRNEQKRLRRILAKLKE